jgi:MFS-type transporter involved in bile tolerance (Atg22 family)
MPYPLLQLIYTGDQEGLFKLVTLDRILNRITGVTSGCWWLVLINDIPMYSRYLSNKPTKYIQSQCYYK